MLNRHGALLNLKQAALLKIMLRVVVLIMQHASIMLHVDLARVRLPLIISLPPKKTAPVFLTQLVCIIFLSAFGDIMQTENNGFGRRSVIIYLRATQEKMASRFAAVTSEEIIH